MRLELLKTKSLNSLKNIILSKKKFFEPRIKGIYFLISKNEIVYVGQSCEILSRVETHRKQNKKIFDSFSYFEYDFDNLDNIEAYFIFKLKPKYNVTIPENDTYKTLHQIKNILNISKPTLTRFMKSNKIKHEDQIFYDIKLFQKIDCEKQ